MTGRVSLLAVVVAVLGPCAAYNVDMNSAVVYRSPEDNMFGFSVTGYRDQRGSWVLVGAPRAQTVQEGVKEGGAVYRCSTEPEFTAFDAWRTCEQIPFDTAGNKWKYGRPYDEKSGQWFGTTVVASAGPNDTGTVVACAPRYRWFSKLVNSSLRQEPIGTCFLAKDQLETFVEISPCRTSAFSFSRQGSCQVGFGTALTQDASRLYIGAVGSWTWQGQLYSHPASENYTAGLSTRDGPESEDSSFLGLSVAAGDFTGDGVQDDVVVGVPRGANLTGKVVLYDVMLQNLLNITGDQIGAGFGYSVCVADVNGDRQDDILVGSPFHSDFTNSEGSYETGMVTIAYQSRQRKFKRLEFLKGKLSRGRFGLAVASLGDLDLDGYADIAVGAPHTGMSELGAVYIFHGSKQGLNQVATQVISASDVGVGLRSFGYSVQGGFDLDNNQYPDLTVGSFHSNSAIYFRSRPVVHVESSLRYKMRGIGSLWDLSDRQLQCDVLNRQVACASAEFCLTYNGIGVDKRAEFQLNIRLDARHQKSPRMFLRDLPRVSNINKTMRAVKGRQTCRPIHCYVDQDSVRDKLTPLVVEVNYELVHRMPGRQRQHLPPVLSRNRPAVASDSLSIQKNCGRDNVCVPDLRLDIKPSHAAYMLGSRERMSMEVTILNSREDAFESMLYMIIPKGVDYVGTEKAGDSSQLPVLCALRSGAQDVLVCDLGNPLPAGSMVHFHIHLMPRSGSGSGNVSGQGGYEFNVIVNSTNPEQLSTHFDNQLIYSVPIRVHAQLVAFGLSVPEVVTWNSSGRWSFDPTREGHTGPEVHHVYELINSGPSDIRAAQVHIYWPTYTLKDGLHLMYLMEQPIVEGPVACDEVPDVNPLRLQIERKPWSKVAVRSADLQKRRIKRTRRTSSPYSSSASQSSSLSSSRSSSSISSSRSSSSISSSHSSSSLSSSRSSNSLSSSYQPSSSFSLPSSSQLFSAPPSESCGPTRCTRISCRLGPLDSTQHVIIRIRARLWLHTAQQITGETSMRDLAVSSRLLARVTELPHQVDPSYMNETLFQVTTMVQSDEVDGDPVPWWVIVLASCGGVLILLVLILLLYLMGFFNRKRLPPAEGTNGKSAHVPPTNGSNGTNGTSYYGYQNIPYDQPGDEAL